MALLRAPDISFQVWLRIGSDDGSDREEENIFIMDTAMLQRFIEEIEKITSLACKLERMQIK